MSWRTLARAEVLVALTALALTACTVDGGGLPSDAKVNYSANATTQSGCCQEQLGPQGGGTWGDRTGGLQIPVTSYLPGLQPLELYKPEDKQVAWLEVDAESHCATAADTGYSYRDRGHPFNNHCQDKATAAYFCMRQVKTCRDSQLLEAYFARFDCTCAGEVRPHASVVYCAPAPKDKSKPPICAFMDPIRLSGLRIPGANRAYGWTADTVDGESGYVTATPKTNQNIVCPRYPRIPKEYMNKLCAELRPAGSCKYKPVEDRPILYCGRWMDENKTRLSPDLMGDGTGCSAKAQAAFAKELKENVETMDPAPEKGREEMTPLSEMRPLRTTCLQIDR